MSISINLEELSFNTRKQIAEDLEFQSTVKKDDCMIYPYFIFEQKIYLPFSYTLEKLQLSKYRRPRSDFPTLEGCKFKGTLRDYQKKIEKKAIKMLNKTGTCVLALHVGAGKTITTISLLVSKIKLKALIITHRIVLINQWKSAIEQFCENINIQILSSKSKMNSEADIYIMNPLNIPKMGQSFFDSIGVIVCDEVHLIATEILSKSLQYICPRYCIALSATPTRPDGLDILIDIYFGKEKIIKKLFRPHIVYRVATKFVPTVEKNRFGKVDWNLILQSQSLDQKRNTLITKIVQKFKNNYFLILCKRLDQINILKDMLSSTNESVTTLVRNQTTFDENARILLSTTSKCGVGFDHPKLNALIVASDIEEYFIQYLGRIFRTLDVEPIIFDLVDENNILKSHWATRRKVYVDHGGVVKIFKDKL